MDIRKFTTNSQQALQDAQAVAYEHRHPQVDVLHLLTSLLQQDDSIVLTVLKKMEAPIEEIIRQVNVALKRLPRGMMAAPEGQVHITAQLNYALVFAEKEAKRLGDEFINTEHLLLAILNVDSAGR